jgi:hypothetical protein
VIAGKAIRPEHARGEALFPHDLVEALGVRSTSAASAGRSSTDSSAAVEVALADGVNLGVCYEASSPR